MSKTQTNPLMEVSKSLNNRGLGLGFFGVFFLLLSFFSLQFFRVPGSEAGVPRYRGSCLSCQVPSKQWMLLFFLSHSRLSPRPLPALIPCWEHGPLPGDQCNSAMGKLLTGKAGIKHQLAGHRALLVQLTWCVLGEFKSFRFDLWVQIVVEIFLSR